jgi:hypothetical protein
MSTKAEINKAQVIAGLQEARLGLLKAASAVPGGKRETVFLGSWSLRDLLAHLAGWDFTNLQAVQEVLSGRLPSFYAHHDRDWAAYNAILVAKYKCDSIDALLEQVRDSQRQLIATLQSVPSRDFNRDFGVRFRGYKVTVRRLLEAEMKDEQVHCRQILDFFGGAG